MAYESTRRHFFFGSLLAGAIPVAGFGSVPSLRALGYKSPNEKLNIASIGAGGKASSDISGCSSENIVALCDVDWRTPAELGQRANDMASATIQKYPDANRYDDWRIMLDEMDKQIDAVVVNVVISFG